MNDVDSHEKDEHIDIDDEFVEKIDDQINRHKDEAPGCHITNQDIPLIIASIACFLAFFVYGACLGSLGAALPELAVHYYKTEEEFSSAFTARGIGYFVGTLSSAAIIELPKNKLPLLPLVCVAILILGIATCFLSLVNHYTMILIVFGIQGIGAGGVDTFGNCLLPALWDVRVSPWMQTMHSFFGVGSVVGPTLIGSLGYSKAFIILGITSISPILLLAFYGCVTGISGSHPFHQTGNSSNHPSTSVKHSSIHNQYGKLSIEDTHSHAAGEGGNSFTRGVVVNNTTHDSSSNNTTMNYSQTMQKQDDDDDDGSGSGIQLQPELMISSSSSSSSASSSSSSLFNVSNDAHEFDHIHSGHDNSSNNSSNSSSSSSSNTAIRRRQQQDNSNNSSNNSNSSNMDNMKIDIANTNDTDDGDTDNDSHINSNTSNNNNHPHHHSTIISAAYSFSIPWSVRLLITAFFIIYSGIETSYGGWISSYAIEKHVANSEEKAALVESSYWAALTVGRIIAIPMAVFISATRMIRMQLILCLIGSILVMTLASHSYDDLIIASVVFGYALSSIQAIAMTFITDYGYIMDATTTTLFVVGSTLGEAGLPIVIGFIFDLGGPTTLPYSILICTVLIIILYLLAHSIAKSGSIHFHEMMIEMKESMRQQVVEPLVNSSSSSFAMVANVSTHVSVTMNNKMSELTEKIGMSRSTSNPSSASSKNNSTHYFSNLNTNNGNNSNNNRSSSNNSNDINSNSSSASNNNSNNSYSASNTNNSNNSSSGNSIVNNSNNNRNNNYNYNGNCNNSSNNNHNRNHNNNSANNPALKRPIGGNGNSSISDESNNHIDATKRTIIITDNHTTHTTAIGITFNPLQS